MATMSPLRQRMIEDMRIRNLAPATQQSYLYAVARFSRYFKSPPDGLGMEKVRAYQLHLVNQKRSWTHINQVACALRFYCCRARRNLASSNFLHVPAAPRQHRNSAAYLAPRRKRSRLRRLNRPKSSSGGMQYLSDVLTQDGVDLTGWTLPDLADSTAPEHFSAR
jgi:hypothetical protein